MEEYTVVAVLVSHEEIVLGEFERLAQALGSMYGHGPHHTLGRLNRAEVRASATGAVIESVNY